MDDDIRSRFKQPAPNYAARPAAQQFPAPMFPAAHQPVPARPHHHPQPKPQSASKNEYVPRPRAVASKTKVNTGRWWKVSLSLIIVLGLTGAGLWVYQRRVAAPPNPFSANLQSAAKFPLFYPKKLPQGYAIDNSTIVLSNGAVTYKADNNGKKIVFTIQKAPAGLDFAAFYQKQIADAHNYTTAYGPAVIGNNKGRQLGSLVASGTWVLLSTNSNQVSLDDMSLVMNNLKVYQ